MLSKEVYVELGKKLKEIDDNVKFIKNEFDRYGKFDFNEDILLQGVNNYINILNTLLRNE